MRVLDVGSGAGDVAFLTADLVGETGEVIGADKVAAAPPRSPAMKSRRFMDFAFGQGPILPCHGSL